jgi:hypothetical protein
MEAAFPFRRHLEFFPRGTLDEVWLPFPASKGWPVLTKDKAQRFTPLEKAKIIEHRLKIFPFSSGNLSGADMADLLKAKLSRLDNIARNQVAPFVASISRTGINLRKL